MAYGPGRTSTKKDLRSAKRAEGLFFDLFMNTYQGVYFNPVYSNFITVLNYLKKKIFKIERFWHRSEHRMVALVLKTA